MLLSVAIVVSLAVVVAFLVEPLVRDETELAPLDPRRSRGSDTDDGEPMAETATVRCCRHCGREVRREFTFCGDCARPVPR